MIESKMSVQEKVDYLEKYLIITREYDEDYDEQPEISSLTPIETSKQALWGALDGVGLSLVTGEDALHFDNVGLEPNHNGELVDIAGASINENRIYLLDINAPDVELLPSSIKDILLKMDSNYLLQSVEFINREITLDQYRKDFENEK